MSVRHHRSWAKVALTAVTFATTAGLAVATAGSSTGAVAAAAPAAFPASAAAAAPAAALAAPVTMTPERTVGGPGHAGLYGWGMATMRDGSVLAGDYWNYRVTHWNKNGSPVGDGVLIANKGHGPTQHYAPYGLAVDPRNGDIFMADTDKYTVDVYSETGEFRRTWGSKGTGVNKYLYPSRVAVSSTGRVYVADTWDHTIVMTSDTGVELGTIGGFGTTPGKLKGPHGLSMDAQDNLYVVDTNNFRVQVFSPSGAYVRSIGAGKGTAPGQFAGDMRGVAVDKVNGWVYVVDGEGNKVSKFDLAGNFILRWGSNGHGNGQFADGGREITVDGDGNVWVGDMPNFRAQKFSPTGQYLSQVPPVPAPPPLGRFNAPRGVAVGSDGSIYVSDTYNWRIQRLTNAGAFVQTWGERGRGDYEFNYTRLIDTSPFNNDVIVTDTDNGRIKSYTPDGVFRWSLGTSGPRLGEFRNPHAVAVAQNGNIYVADSNNARVQVVSPEGQALFAFGTLGSADGQFRYPRGIAVDPDGTIWVVDSVRNVIQHFSATGTYLGKLIAAQGTGVGQINNPFGVAVDDERVYVVDTPASQVKVFDKGTGGYLQALGGRGTGLGKLNQPNGIDLTADGRLYIAEQGNERVSVWKITPTP